MADRMKALAAIGMLAEEAEARGDTRATERLAVVLEAFTEILALASLTEQRRAQDAARKRIPRNSATSADAKTSVEFRGNPGNSEDGKTRVPPLTTNSTTTPHTTREAIADLGDVKLQTTLDRVRSLMGEQWSDVAEFLLRRDYATWQGWCDGMLRDVGMASQFTPDDLATVCRDDATLEKRIGSAGILRKFLGYARQERIGSRSPPAGAARSGSTSRRDTKPPPQVYTYPVATDPEQGPKWQT